MDVKTPDTHQGKIGPNQFLDNIGEKLFDNSMSKIKCMNLTEAAGKWRLVQLKIEWKVS